MNKTKVTQSDPAGNEPDTTFDFGANAPTQSNGAPPVPPDSEPPTPPASGPAPDPFDPASLRLSNDFAVSLGVKKAMLTVPVRKPDKAWFVRVHPSDDHALQTAVIELKEDRETYLVAQPLWAHLAGESTFSPRALFTAINRQGVLFLWPVRLPGPDGKVDAWSQSALEAAQLARKGWVRVAANMALGAYDVFEANAALVEPEWPDTSFRDLLQIGFKGKLIDSMDHPVLRKLRGEV
jgi:hypothetical protein